MKTRHKEKGGVRKRNRGSAGATRLSSSRRARGGGSARRRSGAASKRGTRSVAEQNERGAIMITDHETIREWAETRDGKPATVKATRDGEAAGLLRIDFPGYSGQQTLAQISWDEWFKKFDENHLAFLCQEKTKNGRTSRFFKLVRRP